MSTYRIKGDDGVIIDSTRYLELPKGTADGRPSKARPGMIRYNSEDRHRGIEASVIVETSGTRSLEWRRVAHLDQDGKLLTSQLPSTITGSLSYKGTWDADINDVNEAAADTSLTDRLPTAAGKTGQYYIVRADGDGGAAKGHPANDLGAVPADVIPRYRKGDWIVSNGTEWEKVDQSQITSTASQVQISTGSMRDKHRAKSAVSLQDMLDKFVESALDRTGDIITGTIDVSTLPADASRARIRLANGSASLPNLAFVTATDNTTGLYLARTNTIGFSTNGVMRLELGNAILTSSVTVRNIDGSADTPSYSFTNSPTAGMYRAEADVVGFSTSGTERARIYERGIQTLAVIADKSDANKTSYGFTGDINSGIYSPAVGQVAIATAGSTPVTIRAAEVITTVPVRTSNGSATAPSHSFSGDTKTGLFLSKTGFLNVSAFGKDVLELTNEVITAKETVRFVDGTAAIPSISFTSDTTTGIFSDTANTISIAASGEKVAQFDASGTVFSKPIEINTSTGNVKIGSQNSSWIHFAGDKPFHFNKQIQSEGGYKVYNKETALQTDGKIKEDGKLLEDKYVQLIGTTSIYAPGTKNIAMDKDSSLYWYNATDWAKITFEHSGVESDTDHHMLFETGDNGDEYFKFAHKLGGATTNTEWMSIKKDGIAVSGKTNTIGDWTVSTSGLQFKGSNVISIDASGNVTVNGSSTSSSGVNKAGDTMTGQLKINNQGFANALTEVNGTKAALLIPNASFPVTDGTYYQEFIHGSCTRAASGFTQHGSMGIKRSGTTSWQQLYLATGGSDASPTKEWLFDYTGTLTSPGDIFVGTDKVYHAGNKPTLAELGAAPSGFGLGTYASNVTDVNTGLRTTCGFFCGSQMTNRPAWPMAAHTWDYIFNAAYGDAAGYNGMIAMDFDGQGLAFKTISGGVDRGWKYVYHTGYKPTAADVGAAAASHSHTAADVGAAAASHSHTAADVGALALVGGTMWGNLTLQNGYPTIVFRDTDERGAILHNNSNIFYIFRTVATQTDTNWDAGPNGRHPMTLNLLNGDVAFSGNVTAYSDARLKKDVVPLTNCLDKINALNGVNYKRIGEDTDRLECGFIAQEVQKVIPEVIIEQADEEKTLTMDYARLTSYLVEAVKELTSKVKDLEAHIKTLESK